MKKSTAEKSEYHKCNIPGFVVVAVVVLLAFVVAFPFEQKMKTLHKPKSNLIIHCNFYNYIYYSLYRQTLTTLSLTRDKRPCARSLSGRGKGRAFTYSPCMITTTNIINTTTFNVI